ncbi:beta-glucosidase [bacterium D16-51]|nr:beta-glucosidase [bacterium D16-59]RKI59402.1 beta-glucosidase [bacterium D16-51]
MEQSYYDTPLWDNSLSEEERLDYLLGQLTLEEKFNCLGTGCPAIERLGIPAFSVGGEASHGIQARNDQEYDNGMLSYTTILPNPIGMSATWDEELIKEAGAMAGREARGLYHAGKHKSLSVWAPTVDMERDPRWGRTEEGYGEDPYLTGKMAGAYVEGLQGDDKDYLCCAATLKHFYANNMEEGRVYLSSSIDLRNRHEYYLSPFRRVIREHHAEGIMTAYNEVNGIPCMLLKEDIRLAKQWGVGHVVCDGGDVGQTVDFHKYFSRHSETVTAGLEAGVDCFTDDITLVSSAAREAYAHKMITISQIDRALRSHFRVMLRLGLFDRNGTNPYSRIGLKSVDTKENHLLARRVTAESVVLLKNEGALPLSLDKIRMGKERLAVIGPLSDVWYMDWYSGVPSYKVTPVDGICQMAAEGKEGALENRVEIVSEGGFKGNIALENGNSVVKLRLKDGTGRYLGVLPDGKTVGAVSGKDAESFQIEFWGDGKVTFRAESSGLLLTTEDDMPKGQDGRVCAAKKEAFGWFVREIFYLEDSGELFAWDGSALQLGEDGVLRKGQGKSNSILAELVYQKDGIADAVKAAKEADRVLLFLGSNPMITCKEEIDRKDIALPEYQERMLRSVCRVNSNVVLVLISSIPFDISWAKEHIKGILVCASGSMELGNGLADIIFGKKSPAGRLSMTWYASTDGLPPIADYDIIQGKRTYQYYEGEVLYPFGYGLTYSNMEYSSLSVQLERCTHLLVSLQLTNTGEMATDEVVQIYYHKPDSEVLRPRKTLIAFKRVKDLHPGEKRKASFRISLAELKYFDVISEEMLLEAGEYLIYAGASSEQILLEEKIYLQGVERRKRDGFLVNKAENFDSAKNHLLHTGHLGYTAVCSMNEKDVLELSYKKMYLEEAAGQIKLDFWQEYRCHIWIRANGELVGEYQTEPAEKGAADKAGDNEGGILDVPYSWVLKQRVIGFTELCIPVKNIPVQKEFTLSIQWQGMGKLCFYQFCILPSL